MTMTRELPEDQEAERHVLSCCVLDGAETLAKCMELGMSGRTFGHAKYGLFFDFLVKMLGEGKAIDQASVGQELRATRSIDTIGGWPAFVEMTDKPPSTLFAMNAARRVCELAVLRETFAVTVDLQERCYAYSGGGIESVMAGPIGRLLALSTRDAAPEPQWAGVVDEAMARADALIASAGKPTEDMLEFPWPEMTAKFAPMLRGQLVVVAARPSVGKSSLLRPIISHQAKQGRRVYLSTLEVQPVQVVMQLAATASGVGVRQIGKAHARDQEDFKTALKSLRGLGITVSRKDRTLAQIVARCKAIRAQGPLDLICVDHGGLLADIYGAPKDEKVSAIGQVTKTLKTLAGDLGAVVVLLWQLNRESAKDGNREPRLSDLRDSGSLEEDADKVILIHRPGEDPLTNMKQSDTDSVADRPRYFQNVIQAKGRDDGTALMSFYFTRATATFNPAKKPEGSP